MKKLVSVLLVALSIISSITAMATPFDISPYVQDFSSYTVGQNLSTTPITGITLTNTSSDTAIISNVSQTAGGQSLAFSGVANGARIQLCTGKKGLVRVETAFNMVPDTAGEAKAINLYVKGRNAANSSVNLAYICVASNKEMFIYKDVNNNRIRVPVTSNSFIKYSTWYNLVIDINLNTSTVDITVKSDGLKNMVGTVSTGGYYCDDTFYIPNVPLYDNISGSTIVNGVTELEVAPNNKAGTTYIDYFNVQELDPSKKTLDFSTYAQGRNLATNAIYPITIGNVPTNGTATIDYLPSSQTVTALKLLDSNTGSSGTNASYIPAQPLTGNFSIETEVITDSTLYIEAYNGSSYISRTLFRDLDDIQIGELSDNKNIAANGYTYKSKGLSYKIKLDYNTTAKTYDISVTADDFAGKTPQIGATITGNTYQRKNIPYNTAVSAITAPPVTSFKFAKADGNGSSYIKYVNTQVYSAPIAKSVELIDINNSKATLMDWVPTAIKKINVSFSTSGEAKMNAGSLAGIYLRAKNGNSFAIESASYNEATNVYTLNLEQSLAYNTIYEVVIPNTVIDERGMAVSETVFSFTTRYRDVSVESVSYTVGNVARSLSQLQVGDEVKLKLEIKNKFSVSKTATVALAYYVNNKLICIDISPDQQILSNNVLNTVYSNGITLPSGFDSQTAIIKGFILENTDTLRPFTALTPME